MHLALALALTTALSAAPTGPPVYLGLDLEVGHLTSTSDDAIQQGARLAIVVRPRFYQTVPFYAALGLLLAVAWVNSSAMSHSTPTTGATALPRKTCLTWLRAPTP